MKCTPLAIPEVLLLEPRIFEDNRGFFFESFNNKHFEECVGRNVSFVQDNHSYSVRGVVRGLHYQLAPHAQGKLVRVARGEIFDVAVDLRKSSPTFGKWVAAVLSGENRKQLWIPEGFGHGFMAVSDSADVLYKSTDYYAPGCERSIIWSDHTIGIQWPDIGSVIVSEKDLKSVGFGEAEVFE